MTPNIDQLAGNYYTGLLEQGVPKARAGAHTRQRFGLTDDQLRFVMAHNFMLEATTEGDESFNEDDVNALMRAYTEAVRKPLRRITTDDIDLDELLPYYGD